MFISKPYQKLRELREAGNITKSEVKDNKRLSKSCVKFETGDHDYIAVMYNTIIVKKSKNILTLNSGGYHTRTTKKNINRIINTGYVEQTDGIWYYFLDGRQYKFEDGMKIDLNGRNVGDETPIY